VFEFDLAIVEVIWFWGWLVTQQAQQLARLVMEAEQEDFDKSMDNLTKHCNAYAPTIFKTPAL
jgi:hypothetical protein